MSFAEGKSRWYRLSERAGERCHCEEMNRSTTKVEIIDVGFDHFIKYKYMKRRTIELGAKVSFELSKNDDVTDGDTELI